MPSLPVKGAGFSSALLGPLCLPVRIALLSFLPPHDFYFLFGRWLSAEILDNLLPHFLTLSLVLHEVVVSSIALSLNSYECHQPTPSRIVVPRQVNVKVFRRSKVGNL